MKAFKIKIEDEAHCVAVQLAMYEMGYFWGPFPNSKEPQFLEDNIMGMCVYESGHMIRYYVNDDWTLQDALESFESNQADEYVLVDTRLIPLTEAVALEKLHSTTTLKPRYIHEAQRTQEILKAMLATSEAGKDIPKDWKDELFDLLYAKEPF